ncbi:Mu transposase C-terminal domain-containing protein [Pelagibacterium nitratireducens]|uniref:Mu transposase C-terminal domain-containing protein n=1 Tax=Pelagibacterium nitratireducens TaxID=1046114 RepID=A0ABZ2I419_9HYPH
MSEQRDATGLTKPWERLGLHDMITINAVKYSVQSSTKDGQVLREIDRPDVSAAFTHAQYDEIRQTANFSRIPEGLHPDVVKAHSALGAMLMGDLSDQSTSMMRWREDYVLTLIAMHEQGEVSLTHKSVAIAIAGSLGDKVDEIQKERQLRADKPGGGTSYRLRKRPGARRVLQWRRDYLKNVGDILHLGDRKPLCGGSLLQPEVAAIISEEVAKYATLAKPHKSQIVIDTQDRVVLINVARRHSHLEQVSKGEECEPPELLRVPDRKTILAAINRLDKFTVMCGRHGIDYAVKRMPAVRGSTETLVPLQRIEFDESPVDLLTLATLSGVWTVLSEEQRAKIKRKRRWLGVAIDVATRCVVGMHIANKGSTEAAIPTFKMILEDKSHLLGGLEGENLSWHQCGGFSQVVMDQGSGNISDRTRTALSDLGVKVLYAPAGDPAQRGVGERIFRTVGTYVYPRVDGRTFSNVRERGDYPSKAFASLTDDELARVMVAGVVGYYHNMPHKELNGKTPYEAWEKQTDRYGVTGRPDANHTRVAFGFRKRKRATRYGITHQGLHYTNDEIDKHYLHGGGELEIAYDPDDLGYISVRTDTWTAAPCLDPDMKGVSIKDWQAVCAAERHIKDEDKERRVMARHAAKQAIRGIQDNARSRATILYSEVSAEQIDRAEKRIFGKYAMAHDDMPVVDGQLGEAVETISEEDQNATQPSSPQQDDWDFTDK